MIITFSPQRRDDTISLIKETGETIRINGELFNFDPLQEGDMIPKDVVPCEWITGPVERKDGHVHLNIILPHGPNPSQAVSFPETITVTETGPIPLPTEE